MYQHPQCGQALNCLILWCISIHSVDKLQYCDVLTWAMWYISIHSLDSVIYQVTTSTVWTVWCIKLQHPQSGQCDVSSYNIHSLDKFHYCDVPTSTVWTTCCIIIHSLDNVLHQHPQSGQCCINIHSLDSVASTSTVWTVLHQHPQSGQCVVSTSTVWTMCCINIHSLDNVLYQHPQSGQCVVLTSTVWTMCCINIHSLDNVLY